MCLNSQSKGARTSTKQLVPRPRRSAPLCLAPRNPNCLLKGMAWRPEGPQPRERCSSTLCFSTVSFRAAWPQCVSMETQWLSPQVNPVPRKPSWHHRLFNCTVPSWTGCGDSTGASGLSCARVLCVAQPKAAQLTNDWSSCSRHWGSAALGTQRLRRHPNSNQR